LADHWVNLSGD
jgi:hypothetical protein